MVDVDLHELLGGGGGNAGDVNSDADDGGGVGEELAGGGSVDVESICDSVLGLSAEDAEWEVREALRKASQEVSEADVLGILLRVFRAAREATMRDNDGWEELTEHCNMLTRICDCGFLGSEGSERQELPAAIVGVVYAECGRTFAVAGKLAEARDRLEKALNVFRLLPDANKDDATLRQVAATHASLARVLRRRGNESDAMWESYMEALQLYAQLHGGIDTREFLSEFCEVLGESDAEDLSSSLPALLSELAEEKFDAGSDSHMRVTREIADACSQAGRPELGAAALVSRATALRARCGPRAGAMLLAEAETAEEEAASALEAALPGRLEIGDLEGAADAWEQALQLRESAQGSDSEVVRDMRTTLAALRHAAAGTTSSDDAAIAWQAAEATSVTASTSSNVGAATDLQEATKEAWDEDEEAHAESQPKSSAPPAQPSLLAAGGTSFRPAWAKSPGPAAANDGWED
eukprot:TRINITY_DN21722_c0_g1_i1.p1 TRINITY_DN21722_c0_g1~~TRINITY_DN21722_c0_g1_i1.p1  ORF type:complete len:480 (+),score=121.74 TRINITY_DN21722_c0_g1_i1:41-1441(+)